MSNILGTNNVDVIRTAALGGSLAGLPNATDDADTVSGLGGGDGIFAGGGDDLVNGGEGGDRIIGGAGADTLNGEAGDDRFDVTILSDLDSDVLDGGTGNDTLWITVPDPIIDLTRTTFSNLETINVIGNNQTVLAGTAQLAGLAALFTGSGGRLDLATEGVINLVGRLSGFRTVDGSSGDDNITVDDGATTLRGGEGADTLTAPGSTRVEGGVGNDVINGGGTVLAGDGDDIVNGGSGGNAITGGAGADTLDGHGGNDAFLYASLEEADGDVVIGGDGPDDRIRFDIAAGKTIDLTRFASIASVEFVSNSGTNQSWTGTAASLQGIGLLLGKGLGDTFTLAAPGTIDLTGKLTSFTTVNGTDGDDAITADIETSLLGGVISGGAGADTLTGSDTRNTFVGGLGADMLDGRGGNDTFRYASLADMAGDVVIGGEGNDAISLNVAAGTLVDLTLFAGVSSVEELFNDGSSTAWTGNTAVLSGIGSINGGFSGTAVFMLAAAASINLGDNKFSGFDRVVGSAGGDTIEAGLGTPSIDPGDGDDLVNAGGGTDFLIGSAGADTLNGEDGNDTYYYTALDDLVGDRIAGGDGTDQVRIEVSAPVFDLSSHATAGIERYLVLGTPGAPLTVIADAAFLASIGDIFSGMGAGFFKMARPEAIDLVTLGGKFINFYGFIGSDGADTIIGSLDTRPVDGADGNDALFGGAGNQNLEGGAGADTAHFSGNLAQYAISQIAGGKLVVTDLRPGSPDGTDTLSNVEYQQFADVRIAFGFDATDGGDTINGTAQADFIPGLAGNDSLRGLGGDDLLDGGPGSDSLVGGAGNDSYVVDDPNDRILETRTGGADTVHASVTWTLGAHLDNLVLLGDAPINGTGNNLNNVVTGNDAANQLIGAGRADTLIGGGGNDLYLPDATDTLLEQENGGYDAVILNATFALSDHIEELRFNGTANARGDGNAANNLIVGNVGGNRLLGYDGNDTLSGGQGNDTLQGGEGADSLAGGEGADRLDGGNGDDSYLIGDLDLIVELVGGGTDTVLSSVTYTLTGTVENLTLLGNGDLSGTGNALANVLTGNGGANLLRGLGEADRISGGQGADTIEGGVGADTLTGSGGFDLFLWLSPADGADVVTDFRPGDDSLAFTGAAFDGLAPGLLDAAHFAEDAPTAAMPQFVYTKASGVLEWDADGSGGGAAVMVATLSNKATLIAGDVLIV